MNRFFDFVVDQIQRCRRHPRRIFAIPYNLCRAFFRKSADLFGLPQEARIFVRWLKATIRTAMVELLFLDNPVSHFLLPLAKKRLPSSLFALTADHHFQIANKLLDANEPEAAWKSFRACLRFSNEPVHFFVSAICLMVGLGRFQDAMALFTRGNALLAERAAKLGLADSKFRFLDHFWVGGFGHMAQMDYFIKLEILEGRSLDDSVLYIPRTFAVPNRFFLDQWRPFINVVEDEADLPMPLGALYPLSFYFLAPRLADNSTVHLWEVGAKTYQRWEEERRSPLLKLDASTTARGWDLLEKQGISRDAWFAVLHVREAGSKKYHVDLHNVLNADIRTYGPAIEEITRRGGWVVRMGDPSMTPLPASSRVFDYCRSDIRSDWMDIFLAASARFFVGTSSGPAYVPTDYGVPCVHTNWWPPAQRPWHSRDIFMPKLYRNSGNGRFLTLSQSLAEPFGYCNSISYLKRTKNVEVVENSADDIQNAVVEMLERLDGKADYNTDDVELREKAEFIYRSSNVHGAAVLSRAFARKHSSLIE